MAGIKEFTTSVKAEVTTWGNDVTYSIDGREVVFKAPTSGQMIAGIIGVDEDAEPSELVKTTLNFFFSLVSAKDHAYFRRRLLDYDDPFNEEDIANIVSSLVEEWSARPTKQPSDYLPSQRNGGPRSTAKRQATASTPSS